jgi:hypothetical protein
MLVSVCRPLAAPCAPGAAACVGSASVGNASQSLVLTGTEVSLTLAAPHASTRIIFACSTVASEQNHVTLAGNVSGAYTLLWPTHLVCPAVVQVGVHDYVMASRLLLSRALLFPETR